MSTERQTNADSLSRVVAILTCFSLVVFSFVALSGCSESAVKEPEKKKPVVQDLNVEPDDGASASSNDGSTTAKAEKADPKDEIESLPFETGTEKAEKEKQLPELGFEG